MRPKRPLAERFAKYVQYGSPSECWPWTGTTEKFRGGYRLGRITDEQGRTKRTHRVAWELAYGPIPAQMYICHKCDNPICVNPSHLFLGTRSTNALDMHAKGRNVPIRIYRGTEHGRAKLSEVDVLAIRRSQASYSAIATRYGVTSGHVHRIKARKLWRHLGEAQ